MEKENQVYTFFDLEQAILQCWTVTDDLKAGLDPEILANYYQQKFEHTFNIFSKLQKDHYDRATSSS